MSKPHLVAAPARGLRDRPLHRPTPVGQRSAEELSAEIERVMAQGNSRDRVFGFGSLHGMAGLSMLAAAPLGWALGQFGLIPGPLAFARGEAGRALAMLLGPELVTPAYWLGLGLAAWVLQICRPLASLLLIGGMLWWSWFGLALAHEAGLIAMPINPPSGR